MADLEKPTKRSDETPIQFKPLSAGLGFHPFAEGLPYAPLSKAAVPSKTAGKLEARTTPRPMGLGAEAAGFARPIRNVPKVTQKIAPKTVTQTIPRALPKLQSPHSMPLPNLANTRSWYLTRRAGAFLFDAVMSFLLFSLSISIFFTIFHATVGQVITADTFTSLFVFYIFVHWTFVTLQEILFKTSIGKAVFGLRLRGERWSIFLRSIFSWVSIGVMGIGIFWAFFDPDKRALHDVISGVQPE